MVVRAYDEVVHELVTASRAFVGIAIRSIEASPVEVTVSQHRLLVLLAAHGPQSVGDIAELLGVNPSNASRHCDRLERLGLVARARSSDDGRVVQIELTGDGRRVLDAVTEQRRADLRQVLYRMALPDVSAVAAALRAFNVAAGEIDDDHWVDRTPTDADPS
ncbi:MULTISPECIES: MarR family winged helix-turn-helix transcriptional regulator [unclassified Nocardioides]|uniref:MarR family winged helix-turn-helix transcriptional regulator n=1 Tax=unclassified Nocardioides TaxID=2615069 RepID=UPI00360EBB3F